MCTLRFSAAPPGPPLRGLCAVGWEALDDGHGTTAAVGHVMVPGVAVEPAEHGAHVDRNHGAAQRVVPRQHVSNTRRQTDARHRARVGAVDRRRRRGARRQEAQGPYLTGEPCRVNKLRCSPAQVSAVTALTGLRMRLSIGHTAPAHARQRGAAGRQIAERAWAVAHGVLPIAPHRSDAIRGSVANAIRSKPRRCSGKAQIARTPGRQARPRGSCAGKATETPGRDRSHSSSYSDRDEADGRPTTRAARHVRATEEAIVNALVAADTMVGINGNTVPALPKDQLRTTTALNSSGLQACPCMDRL